MMPTTNRRAFFASAVGFGVSLSPVIGTAIEDAAGASHVDPVEASAQDHAAEVGAGGWVKVNSYGPDGHRRTGRAWLSLHVGTDGFAYVGVQGKPLGDRPDDPEDMGGWRDASIPAGPSSATRRGETVPESAEAFLRRVLAAAAELAGPN